MLTERASGILLHITSLPSRYGIGDLGPEAREFARFLNKSGVSWWQILPLNPTEGGSGHSPYSSPSAFAGNIFLISPDDLVEDGLLGKKDLKEYPRLSEDTVDFEHVVEHKKRLLHIAWQNFDAKSKLSKKFGRFREEHRHWLNDYALYEALRQQYRKPWYKWHDGLKKRKAKDMEAARQPLEKEMEEIMFYQFLFFLQWGRLRDFCHRQGIRFIGDIPFYVSYDSVDVWANPRQFKLDRHLEPAAVSGVPPDYFSKTGQLWNTPVYHWKQMEKDGYKWWLSRISQNMMWVDMLRLDHFRAFSAYWEVPAGEKTAINGKWVKTPGEQILGLFRDNFPSMPFIAEDLGEIDQPVRDLIKLFDLPGMKLLLFAFGAEMAESEFIPHHHVQNALVYTGTHDNNTVLGWWRNEAPAEDKKRLAQYTGRRITNKNVSEVLNRMVFGSVARMAILPMQDALGLGQEAMMNRPSTANGNWLWRVKKEQLDSKAARYLKQLNTTYNR